MNDRPQATVSVVIPAYNAADTIERTLRSVYAQTSDQIAEVIVMDDGSTDATVQIVKDNHPKVLVFQQANGGRASARNAGVQHATGEFVSFLDADDEYLPAKVERQLEVLAEHPGIDVVLCRGQITEADDNSRQAAVKLPSGGAARQGLRYLTFHDLFQTLTPDIGIGNTGWLVRRALYVQLGGQRADFVRLQDVEFLLRAAGLGYTVAVMPDVLALYHRSSNRLAMCNSPYARAAIAILREYNPTGQSWQAQLLAQDVFNAQLRRQLIASAAILGATDETAEALKLLQEARGMLGGDAKLLARWLMARHLPKMYCNLAATPR
jgi:glycosyltransferase involved in cell wall biosynthesis